MLSGWVLENVGPIFVQDMTEEAMSEMTESLVMALQVRRAPALAKGGFGAPLHNDEGGRWGNDVQHDTADMPVAPVIRDLTWWIMEYGVKSPAPGPAPFVGPGPWGVDRIVKWARDAVAALADNWKATWR
jgi:hypothetical protein